LGTQKYGCDDLWSSRPFCFSWSRLVTTKKGSEDMSVKEPENRLILNEQEERLIRMIREIKYGELHIFITDGKPVRAEEIKKSIKL
jgi:hypothetical protein